MAGRVEISQIVEQAVAEAFRSRVAELREEVCSQVIESVQPVIDAWIAASTPPPGAGPTDILHAAVCNLYDATNQADILKSLLDGIAQFTARSILFVTRGSNLSVWQSRGFADENAVRRFGLDASTGMVARAMQARTPVAAAAAEFDARFVNEFGNPAGGNAFILPLVVREKVAAIIYTDPGLKQGGKSDQSAVQLLVRSAATWLEVMALRKTAASGAEPTATMPELAAQASAHPRESASIAPDKTAAAISPDDLEIHKKAKRFAKLLVDEIKLYNPTKVAEGRQNRDLYQRLREDIDKSRATYEKRYRATSAAGANYFEQEVIRILADNDRSLLGSDFPQ